MRISQAVVLVAALAGVACGKTREAEPASAGNAAGGMGGMEGMEGMEGMPMAMQGVQMLPMMAAHLDSLGTMPPAGMAAAMAAHQDLASRTMDAMGADMRGMNMQPDSAWLALGDSLRQDLAELPGLSGTALGGRMQAHIGRMRRMMALHEGMMKM